VSSSKLAILFRNSKLLRKFDRYFSVNTLFGYIYRKFRLMLVPVSTRELWLVHDWFSMSNSFLLKHELVDFTITKSGPFIRANDGIEYAYDLTHPSGMLGYAIKGDLLIKSEISLILKNINIGDIFFDIGSGFGEYAMNVANSLPDLKVYAFEPSNNTFEMLCKNIQRNGLETQIILKKVALSDHIGIFGLASEKDGKFLLDPSHCGGDAVVHPNEFVEVTTIDEFITDNCIEHVEFIKVDVEGHELAILRGAEKCISKFHPHLLLEIEGWVTRRSGYEPDDIFIWLLNHDYLCVYAVDVMGEAHAVDSSMPISKILDTGYNIFFRHKSRNFKSI